MPPLESGSKACRPLIGSSPQGLPASVAAGRGSLWPEVTDLPFGGDLLCLLDDIAHVSAPGGGDGEMIGEIPLGPLNVTSPSERAVDQPIGATTSANGTLRGGGKQSSIAPQRSTLVAEVVSSEARRAHAEETALLSLVPFNRPYVSPLARSKVLDSLASQHLSGDGPMSQAACAELARITGGGRHFLTPSCTHALELACRLLRLGPGDEVILPSFNFPSAATAVALTGATPVFVDVDRRTKNLTATATLNAVSGRTRAIIVLHYAGVLAPIADIMEIAAAADAVVIEDASHGLGVMTDRGMIGSFGALSCYSFHESKNIQCGEGGSLQVNDPSYIDRAAILRDKGTNRRDFLRGQTDKYSWVDHGSSWLLADPLAALLLGQLEDFEAIQDDREAAFDRYGSELRDWASASGFELADAPIGQRNAAHMFYLVAPSLEVRQSFIAHMRTMGVSAAFHYQPLDASAAGRFLGRSTNCPDSSALGDRLVRLPLFAGILESEVAKVIEAVRCFQGTRTHT